MYPHLFTEGAGMFPSWEQAGNTELPNAESSGLVQHHKNKTFKA